MACVFKVEFAFQGHPTMGDIFVDVTFMTHVFTKVEFIFPQNSALMHSHNNKYCEIYEIALFGATW